MVTPAEHAEHVQLDRLELEPGIERIPITLDNASSWTRGSETLKQLGLELELDPSREGGVQPGEIVWLAKRKKHAEGGWTKLGRLRTLLRDQLVAAGEN